MHARVASRGGVGGSIAAAPLSGTPVARARARARASDRCDLPRDVRPRQKWIADYVAWLTEDVGLLPEVWCGMMWHDMWHDVA